MRIVPCLPKASTTLPFREYDLWVGGWMKEGGRQRVREGGREGVG